ncbi:MAG: hypothetical protein FJ197_01080 [Gammaproteobacteria bacterium]|nr:hypothetical protein [Gammaproteobacteria bacterium]
MGYNAAGKERLTGRRRAGVGLFVHQRNAAGSLGGHAPLKPKEWRSSYCFKKRMLIRSKIAQLAITADFRGLGGRRQSSSTVLSTVFVDK